MRHTPATEIVRPASFAGRVQEPGTARISPVLLAEELGLPLQALAAAVGVHRNTVGQNPASERLQARLRDIVRAVSAAADLTGDLAAARYWFLNEPIADYRYKTAAELVATGRVDAVLSYIEDLRHGASG